MKGNYNPAPALGVADVSVGATEESEVERFSKRLGYLIDRMQSANVRLGSIADNIFGSQPEECGENLIAAPSVVSRIADLERQIDRLGGTLDRF